MGLAFRSILLISSLLLLVCLTKLIKTVRNTVSSIINREPFSLQDNRLLEYADLAVQIAPATLYILS